MLKIISALVFLPLYVSAQDKKLPVVIQVCAKINSQHAVYAYGNDLGIFAKHGLDFQLKPGKGCQETFAAVKSGESTYIVNDSLGLMVAADNAAPPDFKAVVGMAQNNIFAFLSLADRKFKSPADMKGKKVGVLAVGRDKTLLPALLKANGIKVDEVTIMEFPTPDKKLEALIGGQVDFAGHTYHEAPGWVKRGGKQLSVMRVGSHGLALPGDSLIAASSRVGSERDLHCRMTAAVTEAWKATDAKPAAAAASVLKLNSTLEGGDVALIAEQWERYSSLTRLRTALKKPFGYIFDEDWKRTVDFVRDFKVVKNVFKTTDYYTNDFIEGKTCSPKSPN